MSCYGKCVCLCLYWNNRLEKGFSNFVGTNWLISFIIFIVIVYENKKTSEFIMCLIISYLSRYGNIIMTSKILYQLFSISMAYFEGTASLTRFLSLHLIQYLTQRSPRTSCSGTELHLAPVGFDLTTFWF